MISEFGFRASDSGLPNSDGAGPVVTTQAERAAGMSAYIRDMVRLPFVVGYHVFAWVDEPASGNGWQENSNYGLVHLDDDPYTAMVDMYTALHREVAQLHAASAVAQTRPWWANQSASMERHLPVRFAAAMPASSAFRLR